MSGNHQEKVDVPHSALSGFEVESLHTIEGIGKSRIWRKLDTHLLPLLIFLYFLSFL